MFNGKKKSLSPNSTRLSESGQTNKLSVQLIKKTGDRDIETINEITEPDQQNENFNFDVVDLDPFELADESKEKNMPRDD